MHTIVRSNQHSEHITPIRQLPFTARHDHPADFFHLFLEAMKKELVIAHRRPGTDRVRRVPRQVMHKRTVMGVAGIALLAACTTPIASADYAADKKKYDDCVAREKDRVAGAPSPAYYRDTIRNFCGEPPAGPRDEKK